MSEAERPVMIDGRALEKTLEGRLTRHRTKMKKGADDYSQLDFWRGQAYEMEQALKLVQKRMEEAAGGICLGYWKVPIKQYRGHLVVTYRDGFYVHANDIGRDIRRTEDEELGEVIIIPNYYKILGAVEPPENERPMLYVLPNGAKLPEEMEGKG